MYAKTPIALVLLSCILLTGCASQTTYTQRDREHYRATLDEMMTTDQSYRSAISWGTTDEQELAKLKALDDDAHMKEFVRRRSEGIKLDPELEKQLWEKQIAIDRANTDRLMQLVERYGWPDEDMPGGAFSDPVPILIHMQMDDAERVLPVLRDEVLAGRMPGKQYAMIFDRKRQHDGKPQLYGTAQAFDSKTRTVLAPAVVDIEETNAARAEIGLEPLVEFRITDAKTAAGG